MKTTNDKYAVYVHIPFCKSRCAYCAFTSCTDFSLVDSYFNRLYNEIETCNKPVSKVSSVFVGGGTPSSVPVGYVTKLFDVLHSNFDFSSCEEVTVECNPESVTDSFVRELVRCGVNRVSMGLQSVNDVTLSKIGRLHTFNDFVSAVNLLRSYGINNINADVIIGLPETFEQFRTTVDTVVTLPLTHVSAYALELHEGTALFNKYPTGIHDDDTLADMYDYAMATLCANGFCRYEVSNFAKRGYECKHNLTYWREGRYYGFGASSHGFVGNCRVANSTDIATYTRETSEEISNETQLDETLMLGLRLDSGVNVDELKDKFGVDVFDKYAHLPKLIADGFLLYDKGILKVPEDKTYVLNSILCELLD